MLHAHPRVAVAIPLPRRLPKVIRPALEAAIEQHLTAVDGLVKLLDLFDGDADLEPSLGGIAHHGFHSCTQENWASGAIDDREGDEHDGREPGVDDEPSLAHTLAINQTKSAVQATGWAVTDGEAEHDGREPDMDREPSLGSLVCVGSPDGNGRFGFDQSRWALGGTLDLEEQCEDEGSVERCEE